MKTFSNNFTFTLLHTCASRVKLKRDVLLTSVSSPHYRMTPVSLIITHFATQITSCQNTFSSNVITQHLVLVLFIPSRHNL